LTGKTRLRNDLYCIDGDVKLYSLTEEAVNVITRLVGWHGGHPA